MKQRALYIGFMFALLTIASVLVGVYNGAFALTFTLGEKLQHNLSVCIEKSDAIAVMQAEADSGYEGAYKLWSEKDGCATVPVIGPHVGNVVYAVAIVREGKKLIGRVVEIIDGGKVLGYFLTTADFVGLKKERDS